MSWHLGPHDGLDFEQTKMTELLQVDIHRSIRGNVVITDDRTGIGDPYLSASERF